jgi:hypothetical protein
VYRAKALTRGPQSSRAYVPRIFCRFYSVSYRTASVATGLPKPFFRTASVSDRKKFIEHLAAPALRVYVSIPDPPAASGLPSRIDGLPLLISTAALIELASASPTATHNTAR